LDSVSTRLRSGGDDTLDARILVPKADEAKPKRIQVTPGGQMEAIAGSSATS
jgi:hypothetical protein